MKGMFCFDSCCLRACLFLELDVVEGLCRSGEAIMGCGQRGQVSACSATNTD